MSFTGCYTEDEPKREAFYVVGIMYMFWEVFTSYFEILKFSAKNCSVSEATGNFYQHTVDPLSS